MTRKIRPVLGLVWVEGWRGFCYGRDYGNLWNGTLAVYPDSVHWNISQYASDDPEERMSEGGSHGKLEGSGPAVIEQAMSLCDAYFQENVRKGLRLLHMKDGSGLQE